MKTNKQKDQRTVKIGQNVKTSFMWCYAVAVSTEYKMKNEKKTYCFRISHLVAQRFSFYMV